MNWSADTPLASIGVHDLLRHCAKCGTRRRPVTELIEKVGPATRLGDVIPKLRCTCGGKPLSVVAEMAWVRKYGNEPPKIDLTFLISPALGIDLTRS